MSGDRLLPTGISRRLFCAARLLAMLLFTLPGVAQAQFSFTTNADGTLSIAGYSGSATAVTIPGTNNGLIVTSIGNDAFFNNSSLASVSIPDSVTNIGTSAFGNCFGLTSVNIPNGVTSIAPSTFDGCTNLTTLTIPDGVTNIGGSAFGGCQSLTSINIPNGVIGIGVEAFAGCESLTSINIPNGVLEIGDYTFDGCESLTSITIPDSITNIGPFAFASCRSMTSINIPKSVTGIDMGAFFDCQSLTAIMADSLSPVYSTVDGVLFNKSHTTLVMYPPGDVGPYTIPNGVASLGQYAFDYCANLTGITIPGSVTNIGRDSFADCGVTSVTIPSGVTSIGSGAFDSCKGLTNVTISGSVTNIGGSAFEECFSLRGVYFMGGNPGIASTVFQGTPATGYYLPGAMGWTTNTGFLPVVLWNPQAQTSDGSFGVRTNQFGFNITGNSNLVLVVEASASLGNPSWSPVATNILTNGSSYFSDPQWTNYPARFYRLGMP